MPKRQKRILLALGWYDHRLHAGIARYALERGWHLCPDTTREKVIPWGWEGDGILAWLGAGDDLAEFVVHARKPTVDFSFRRTHLPFPRVLADHAGAANLAAEHFLSRGFTHFIFYSDAENWAYEETGRAFVRSIQQAGFQCNWLCWQRAPVFTRERMQWKIKRQWIATQLKKAPKPLAVFAAADEQAVEILETCELAGLSVPEQISIVGMDDSLPAVNAMHIPISSVDTNLELVGYRGAELLEDLMRGRPAPSEPVRVPPTGLIARKSSDLVATNHPGVSKAMNFLLKRFCEPIGVDDLVRAAAMSRRGLHQAFINEIGRPPGHELQRVRIEHAKHLLATSDEKAANIGAMCGYQSPNSFWSAFKQSVGISPQEYRKKVAV
ncbi:MAG TPA: DNA-binding transcriptional regulator [Verrucomicrobiae bacterium]|nr:DNA-binding transcriptional regulator [Verrucomicrobiae bacterium]